jgi:hypothetical protein
MEQGDGEGEMKCYQCGNDVILRVHGLCKDCAKKMTQPENPRPTPEEIASRILNIVNTMAYPHATIVKIIKELQDDRRKQAQP